MALSVQFRMHLAGPVHAEIVGMHRADRAEGLTVTHRAWRLGSMRTEVGSYRGRSDLGSRIAQGRADRIDSVLVAVSRDELHDQRCGRSISAMLLCQAATANGPFAVFPSSDSSARRTWNTRSEIRRRSSRSASRRVLPAACSLAT